MLRKILAITLEVIFILPIRLLYLDPIHALITYIYPQITQNRIRVWADPQNKNKIRFAFGYKGFRELLYKEDKKGVGIKISDWEKLVKNIETQIIWKQK